MDTKWTGTESQSVTEDSSCTHVHHTGQAEHPVLGERNVQINIHGIKKIVHFVIGVKSVRLHASVCGQRLGGVCCNEAFDLGRVRETWEAHHGNSVFHSVSCCTVVCVGCDARHGNEHNFERDGYYLGHSASTQTHLRRSLTGLSKMRLPETRLS